MKGWKGVLSRGKPTGPNDKPLPTEPTKQEVPPLDTVTVKQSQPVPLTSPSTPSIVVSATEDKPEMVRYSRIMFHNNENGLLKTKQITVTLYRIINPIPRTQIKCHTLKFPSVCRNPGSVIYLKAVPSLA